MKIMKSILKFSPIITLLIYGYLIITWVINLIQLFNCDFQPNYKNEIIHALGIIFPINAITVWF